jgi:hypothetical protein
MKHLIFIASCVILAAGCSQLPKDADCWPVERVGGSNQVGLSINPSTGIATPSITHNPGRTKYHCSNGMIYWITE